MNGHVLEPEEVLVERIGREGWAVAADGGVTVALDTTLDDELRLEARVNDLIRAVQVLRKDSGPRDHRPDPPLDPRRRPARRSAGRIAEETLAVWVELGPELRLEKA